MKCKNCRYCSIYVDQSEDMRPPYATCKLGHEIIVVGIMEWKPQDSCNFEEGEPEIF